MLSSAIDNAFAKTFCGEMKVEFLEGGTFWLSESPSVPGSVSWGSVVPCIATWVISFSVIVPKYIIISLNLANFVTRALFIIYFLDIISTHFNSRELNLQASPSRL